MGRMNKTLSLRRFKNLNLNPILDFNVLKGYIIEFRRGS